MTMFKKTRKRVKNFDIGMEPKITTLFTHASR